MNPVLLTVCILGGLSLLLVVAERLAKRANARDAKKVVFGVPTEADKAWAREANKPARGRNREKLNSRPISPPPPAKKIGRVRRRETVVDDSIDPLLGLGAVLALDALIPDVPYVPDIVPDIVPDVFDSPIAEVDASFDFGGFGD
jgi:hypothetical protein